MIAWVVHGRIARLWQGLSPRHAIVASDLDHLGSSLTFRLLVEHEVNRPGLESSTVAVLVRRKFRYVLSMHTFNLVRVEHLLQSI